MSDLNAVMAALERLEARLIAIENQGPCLAAKKAVDDHKQIFVTKKAVADALGVSCATVDTYKQRWQIGAHWVVQDNGRPLFNLPLILDWRQNAGCYHAHQKAVQKYLRSIK